MQSVVGQGLALKYSAGSGHDICDIHEHDVMFASQSPHFRLDLNMEQKFIPYDPCWSSTMFINKNMWIHHNTMILSLCIALIFTVVTVNATATVKVTVILTATVTVTVTVTVTEIDYGLSSI